MEILLIDGRHRAASATAVVADGLARGLRAHGVRVHRTSGLVRARSRPDAMVYVHYWGIYPRVRHLMDAHPGVPRCYFAADPPWSPRNAPLSIPGEFDVLLHPLRQECATWHRAGYHRPERFTPTQRAKRCHYVPRGARPDLFHPRGKHRDPTVLIDADPRFTADGWSDVDALLHACVRLRLDGVPVRSYLLGRSDPRATRSFPRKISPRQMRALYGHAWVYATNIRSSYELPVIEAQMAGASILSLRHRAHGREAAFPELYDPGRTGLSVDNRYTAVRDGLRALIERHDPAVPRAFALEHHDWTRAARLLLEALESELGLRA